MADLKVRYKAICRSYVEAFLRKHGLYDDETGEYCDYNWIGDDAGSVLDVCDYSISFNDIRYDIDNAIHKDTYFEYYNYSLEHHEKDGYLNYHSYYKGFRFEDKKMNNISQNG